MIRKGEGIDVEFKLKTNHPEKIVREMVAFANTKGGYLFIGIADDKQIKGLKYPDEDEYILSKAIQQYCEPAIPYSIERMVLNEASILIFKIEESLKKPHYVCVGLEEAEVKKAYVRVKDKSVQATKEMREILKGSSRNRNIRFNYGEKEQTLMHYFANNPYITLKKYAEIAQISLKLASRTLIVLVLANVLSIEPDEVEDRFLRKGV